MEYKIYVSPKKRKQISLGGLRYMYGTTKMNNFSMKLFNKSSDKLNLGEIDILAENLHNQRK